MRMRFWKLDSPKYSDYKSSYTNGSLEHPYRLPAAECDECGATVSWDTILPCECPPASRTVFTEPATVSIHKFDRIAAKFRGDLKKRHISPDLVRPGCHLQPGFLDVPSKPVADFLWTGLSSVVVSERIRILFDALKIPSVAFCEVTLRKIGTRSGKASPPVPDSGEPEDIIGEVRVRSPSRTITPYYQLLVLADSGYPPGTEPGPVCKVCGEALEQDWKSEVSKARQRWRAQEQAWKTLTHQTLRSVWSGSPIFYLASRATLLLTEDLKDQLQKITSTNVAYTKFPAA